MLKGSCLCGGVRYEIDGEVGPMAQCYCSMCRKQHWAIGPTSPGLKRGFCRTCGSNLPVPDPAEQTLFIPAGTLDDDPGIRPAAHIFVASKAPWVEITDDLPQFDEYPPGFGPDAESGAPEETSRPSA